MEIKIEVVSVRDRLRLVAELWVNDTQIAEVSREHDVFEVEVYARQLLIPLDDYLAALQHAKLELTK